MERLIRIGFVLLVLSFALNIALFSRVGTLTDEVSRQFNNFNSEWQRITSLTQHNADRISMAVNTIETEQRWITPVNIASANQVGSDAEIQLSWIIKDYADGAAVTFHYRKQDDTEFISQPATSMGDGRFAVKLKEKLKTEPQWKIGIRYIGGNNGESKSSIATGDTTAERPDIMEYYVTVKEGARLKSSEIFGMHMTEISEGIYSPLAAEVQIDRDREKYFLSLIQHISNPKQTKLSRAFLEVYNGDKLVTEAQLTLDQVNPDQNLQIFNINWNYDGQSFNRVFLRIEYENGKQFKKDITESL